MAYHITCINKQTNEQEFIEWITPAGWDQSRVRRVFERRYQATVCSIEPIEI